MFLREALCLLIKKVNEHCWLVGYTMYSDSISELYIIIIIIIIIVVVVVVIIDIVIVIVIIICFICISIPLLVSNISVCARSSHYPLGIPSFNYLEL